MDPEPGRRKDEILPLRGRGMEQPGIPGERDAHGAVDEIDGECVVTNPDSLDPLAGSSAIALPDESSARAGGYLGESELCSPYFFTFSFHFARFSSFSK